MDNNILTDPVTGQHLPPESIQRVLFTMRSVCVYNIPPLNSNKGYVAASWTANKNARHIFTARLRVLETAIPVSPASSSEKLRFDILLEDPNSGELFAAAPYSQPEVVQQALDSSRFFALRIQGNGGQKAMLGIGFEERSEAFDFSITLQEIKKMLKLCPFENSPHQNKPEAVASKTKQDFRLKEGEMVVVDLGTRGRRKGQDKKKTNEDLSTHQLSEDVNYGSLLPPPPSAEEIKKRRCLSATFEPPNPGEHELEELGFDNGEFGEFQ